MIRVIVELHPSQLREHWRLGTIDISNVSDLSPLADYKVQSTLTEREGEPRYQEADVVAHPRDEGWQRLVERSLRALQAGGVRVRAPSVAVCEEALNALQELYGGLTPEGRSKHKGDLDDVERLLQWVRIHGPAHDEGPELMRLREVIRTGGAMYRLERAAMGYPGGEDSELATCRTCGERSKHLEAYCVAHSSVAHPSVRSGDALRPPPDEPEGEQKLDQARVLAIRALSEVEWQLADYTDELVCILCGGRQSKGHAADCLLDMALMACRKAAPSTEV